MLIIADDKIPFLKGVFEPFAEVVYLPGKQINNDVVKKADALLVRTRTKCTDSLLEGSNVKFIGTATIGFDHIDTHYCERKNIVWTNAPGCNSASVKQYITAALLKLSRDYQIDLSTKTIGIIGVGNVGSKVEEVAGMLGMKVLLNDPPRARKEGDDAFISLGKLLVESDIVTVHVPLNIVGDDCTYHLFDGKTFKKMKKGAWFINCSRGEVVDSSSLKRVSDSKLGGTILDVWENEPDIDLDLMAKAFIATPHIAGYSTDGKANGTAKIVNALSANFNLPLKKWYPSNVPPPENQDIFIDCKGKSDADVLSEAVFHTYNIEEDDIKLRFSPSDFEKQRGDYPLRREFPSYSIKLVNSKPAIMDKLKELGFILR